MFGKGLVDGNNGERQDPLCLHCLEALDACRGLFGCPHGHHAGIEPALEQGTRQVCTVVAQHMRLDIECDIDMRTEGIERLAAYPINRNFVVHDQRRSHVVLGRQRVRGNQHDLGTARGQRPHQGGGFGGYMQTDRDAQSFERSFLAESLADAQQYRHVAFVPIDFVSAGICQRQVSNLVIGHGGPPVGRSYL